MALIANSAFATGKQVANNKKLGRYYTSIDFDFNDDLTTKEVTYGDAKGRKPVIGNLLIGGNKLDCTLPNIKQLRYDLEEQKAVMERFNQKTRVVPIKHREYELSHAEIDFMLDLVETIFYTFRMKESLNLFN